VRWRCPHLKARIEREFQVSFHERTIGKLLARPGFRRLSVRPQHPRATSRNRRLLGAFADRVKEAEAERLTPVQVRVGNLIVPRPG
jgi:hypothetical protein